MRRKDDSYRKSLELITEPNIQSVIRRKNWPTLNEILTACGRTTYESSHKRNNSVAVSDSTQSTCAPSKNNFLEDE